jgi:Transglycosylase SLT domain/D-alanyl-D-alanine carboxypeptidase
VTPAAASSQIRHTPRAPRNTSVASLGRMRAGEARSGSDGERGGSARWRGGCEGQASVLLVGMLLAILVAAIVLGAVARGVDAHAAQQRAADLAALAGARAMRDAYDRLFEPAFVGGRPNPAHLSVAGYLSIGESAARETAKRNGAGEVDVTFPDRESFAPVRIAVVARARMKARGRGVTVVARAEAELAPPTTLSALAATGDEYRGPLAYRQGKPMRPDVAAAFDRMHAAARAAGVALVINSAFRSNAEQAALFAQHPDPKWVAPPGRSLHRLGTELDLGPPSAYGWLSRNAERFGFIQRYSWEPWHYGYVRSAGTRSVGYGPPDGAKGMPTFVPERFAPAISRAAQRWNVGAALLAAQLYAESNFNPFATSPAGAQGIAQFMPATAAAYGLRNPFDARAAIDAQAHLMHDLLRRFGSVPLALAAYNAGAGAVARCGCIPPYPETRGYVARILGLLGGAGEAAAGGGLDVRLVR